MAPLVAAGGGTELPAAGSLGPAMLMLAMSDIWGSFKVSKHQSKLLLETHRVHWPTADSTLAVTFPAAIAHCACWRDIGSVPMSALFAVPALFWSDGDEARHPAVETVDWNGRPPPVVCYAEPDKDKDGHKDCYSDPCGPL